MSSLLGRAILTIGALITLIGVNIADWNDAHVFSELWSPHARFHGAWWIFTISLLSALCLWLLWSSEADRQFQTTVAVLIQACIWMAFFPAMLIPAQPWRTQVNASTDCRIRRQFVPCTGADGNSDCWICVGSQRRGSSLKFKLTITKFDSAQRTVSCWVPPIDFIDSMRRLDQSRAVISPKRVSEKIRESDRAASQW